MYNGKKVFVLGLAKSGWAAAKRLRELGADVVVNDRNEPSEQQRRELEALGIRLVCGGHPLELLDEPFDFVVKIQAFRTRTSLYKKRLTNISRSLPKWKLLMKRQKHRLSALQVQTEKRRRQRSFFTYCKKRNGVR